MYVISDEIKDPVGMMAGTAGTGQQEQSVGKNKYIIVCSGACAVQPSSLNCRFNCSYIETCSNYSIKDVVKFTGQKVIRVARGM